MAINLELALPTSAIALYFRVQPSNSGESPGDVPKGIWTFIAIIQFLPGMAIHLTEIAIPFSNRLHRGQDCVQGFSRRFEQAEHMFSVPRYY